MKLPERPPHVLSIMHSDMFNSIVFVLGSEVAFEVSLPAYKGFYKLFTLCYHKEIKGFPYTEFGRCLTFERVGGGIYVYSADAPPRFISSGNSRTLIAWTKDYAEFSAAFSDGTGTRVTYTIGDQQTTLRVGDKFSCDIDNSALLDCPEFISGAGGYDETTIVRIGQFILRSTPIDGLCYVENDDVCIRIKPADMYRVNRTIMMIKAELRARV